MKLANRYSSLSAKVLAAGPEEEICKCKFQLDTAILFGRYPYMPLLHAEEDQGKTEPPTEAKKRKARQEGQVFLTQELPQGLLILFVITTVFLLAGYYYNNLAANLGQFAENPNEFRLDLSSTAFILRQSSLFFMKLLAPVALIAWVTVVLATMLQTKFFINAKALRFNPKKIAPSVKNFLEKTVFSKTQLVNSLRIVIKTVFGGVITFFFLYSNFERVVQLFRVDLLDASSQFLILIYQLMLYLGFLVIVIAVPDWIVQRILYLRKLYMSKEEVKRELKELEGDPHIRQRQRQRARELARRNMISMVKEADIVITNPTHFACALQYEIEYMDAPKLVSKGADELALKIREEAKKHAIQIVENKPLARLLYEKVEVGNYVPREFFTVLAEVLATLDKFKTT